MNESLIVSVVVSLCSISAHVAVVFYAAGRVKGDLELIKHQLRDAAVDRAATRLMIETHLQQHHEGVWGPRRV